MILTAVEKKNDLFIEEMEDATVLSEQDIIIGVAVGVGISVYIAAVIIIIAC